MAKPFIILNPKMQFTDNNGNYISGGKLFVYQPGTTTKQNTYTDSTLSVANPNPVILDTLGRPSNNGVPIDMYINSSYKLVLAPATDSDPPQNAIWTEDNLVGLQQITQVKKKTTTYTLLTTDQGFLIECDASGGSFTVNLLASAIAGSGFVIKFKKIDSSTNAVTIQCSGSETWDGSNAITLATYNAYAEGINDGTQWLSTQSPSKYQNNVQVFTTTGTFTVPANVSTVYVEAWGGAGSGGGSTSASLTGGGGGGGAYAAGQVAVTPGGTVTVTVGASVAGVTSNVNTAGTNGNASSFGSSIIAAPGSGGGGSAGGTGGAGGTITASTGTVLLAGQPGATPVATFGALGLGGAAPMIGLTSQVGVVGANGLVNTSAGGAGGSSTVGSGAGGSGLVIIHY